MSNHFSFTKEQLERIKPKDTRQYYYDTKEPRLGLYVTPGGHKSWFAKVQTGGGMVRRPFGKFENMSLTAARHRALDIVADGDPVVNKRRRKKADITLAEVLNDYLEAKSHKLKPGTVFDYKRAIRENYGDWMVKPLADITEQKILQRHKKRGAVSQARTANAERVLHAVFNYARGAYKSEGRRLFPENPVAIIKELDLKYSVDRRRTILRSEDFPEWWATLQGQGELPRQLIEFCLFTGCRKTEASSLTWEQISFKTDTFTLTDTKNRLDVELPLPARINKQLHKRRQDSGPVFPAPTKTGHMDGARNTLVEIFNICGVYIQLHDLRRTYVSTANSLNLSPYTTKMLVNHKFDSADITAGYDVPELDRLKDASAKIEAKLLRLAKGTSARVVAIR